ncbi:MAG: riboflavin synthase [Candidatus Aadella gelida]|nr:riboflavin synthase [Candidatus Aadella gelida]
MFTGIISEIGKIKKITRKPMGSELTIVCENIFAESVLGDSIAVNGVCLSVNRKKDDLSFDVVGNTLKNSNLKRLKVNDKVNLEMALKFEGKISGHIVTGHVDGERKIRNSRVQAGERIIDIDILPGDDKYLIDKGSVALDGISLTVGKTMGSFFRVFLIPHTLENTTLMSRKPGDHINVEFDALAKYNEKRSSSSVTKTYLERNGFI